MSLAETFQFMIDQPLLGLAVAAVLVTTLGGMLRRSAPAPARILQGVGNFALVATLLLTIVQVARFTTGSDFALPQLGMPAQRIEGSETRIPLAKDGHFWLQAKVNGHSRRFLVDTGATLTAISETTAIEASVPQNPVRRTLRMRTANGTVDAELATIAELRFGNIVARDLDAVVAPGLENTNVIGMNLLTRLASWRVEGNTMILVPRNPQSGS